MYQLLPGKTIKLRLVCIWVKYGFSAAATSAFYTFKIRRSAGLQIRILPPAALGINDQWITWIVICAWSAQLLRVDDVCLV